MGWDINGDIKDIWARFGTLKVEHVALTTCCMFLAFVFVIISVCSRKNLYMKIASSFLLIYIALQALIMSTQKIRTTVIADNDTIDTNNRLSTMLSFVCNFLMMMVRLLLLCIIWYMMLFLCTLLISVHTYHPWMFMNRHESKLWSWLYDWIWTIYRILIAGFEIIASLGKIFLFDIIHDEKYKKAKPDERKTLFFTSTPSPFMEDLERLVVPDKLLQLVNLANPKNLYLHITTILACTIGAVFYGLFGIPKSKGSKESKQNLTEQDIQNRFVEGLNVFTFIIIFVYVFAMLR